MSGVPPAHEVCPAFAWQHYMTCGCCLWPLGNIDDSHHSFKVEVNCFICFFQLLVCSVWYLGSVLRQHRLLLGRKGFAKQPWMNGCEWSLTLKEWAIHSILLLMILPGLWKRHVETFCVQANIVIVLSDFLKRSDSMFWNRWLRSHRLGLGTQWFAMHVFEFTWMWL